MVDSRPLPRAYAQPPSCQGPTFLNIVLDKPASWVYLRVWRLGMTDRLKGFVVILNSDMREDDANSVALAIGMLRYVASVKPLVANVDDCVAVERAKYELREKLYKAIL